MHASAPAPNSPQTDRMSALECPGSQREMVLASRSLAWGGGDAAMVHQGAQASQPASRHTAEGWPEETPWTHTLIDTFGENKFQLSSKKQPSQTSEHGSVLRER